MSLKDIYPQLQAQFGCSRATAINWVNRAASQIYAKQELHFAKREQLFDVGTTSQQVALPYYVDRVIHLRLPDSQLPIQPQAYEPKFQREAWFPPFIEFRVKQRTALSRDIENAAQLIFTLAEANSSDFTITIQGSTANAARVNEVLIVSAGTTAVTSTKNYESVNSIVKSVATDSDIVVTDIVGNVMSTIPNYRLSVDYQMLQVLQPGVQLGQSRIVDTLYKVRHEKLVNDNDLFCMTDVYDDAVFWYAKSLIYEDSGDRTGQDAGMAMGKAIELITAIDGAYENYSQHKIQWGPNQVTRATRYPFNYGWRSGRTL